MEANQGIVESTLDLTGIANASIAYASFGMTTDDQSEFWNKVRKGTTRALSSDQQPLLTTQTIEMILGALSVMDS